MFSWRGRRQLIAFLVVVTPLAVIAFVTVKNAIPAPSCTDNRQNQHETGLDCGGECISCGFKYPQAVKVFWARAVPVRQDMYDVAAEIENPNERLSSVDVEYQFTLFDDFGPVTTRAGKTFIYARERSLVIEAGIETVRPATRAEFQILNVKWQEKPDLAPTVIAERRDYSVVEDQGKKGSKILITLFNKSPYDFLKTEVNVAVLDKDQNLLGVNKIVAESLLSQSRRDLVSLWPEEFTGAISVINVQPRVNIFDPRTIVKPQ